MAKRVLPNNALSINYFTLQHVVKRQGAGIEETFDVPMSMTVIEYVYPCDDYMRKLVWVRMPLESETIDGVHNTLFSSEFRANSPKEETEARAMNKAEFAEHWSLNLPE